MLRAPAAPGSPPPPEPAPSPPGPPPAEAPAPLTRRSLKLNAEGTHTAPETKRLGGLPLWAGVGVVVVGGIIVAILLLSRSNKEPLPREPVREQASLSPRDVFRTYMEAANRGDADAAIACCAGTREQKAYVHAMLETWRDFGEFARTYLAKNPGHQGSYPDRMNTGLLKEIAAPLYASDLKRLDSLLIEVGETEATCRLPRQSRQTKLLKKDGRWFVDAYNLFPHMDSDLGSKILLAKELAATARDLSKKLTGGQDPELAFQGFQEAFTKFATTLGPNAERYRREATP